MIQANRLIAAMFDADSAQLTVVDGRNLTVPREVYSNIPMAAIPDAVHDWAVQNHYLEAEQMVGSIAAAEA